MGSFCSRSLGINIGSSEYSGSSVADDVSPRQVTFFGPGLRQCMIKDTTEQSQLKDVFSFREKEGVEEDHLYDGIPRLPPPQKPRSTRYTQTAVSKVS